LQLEVASPWSLVGSSTEQDLEAAAKKIRSFLRKVVESARFTEDPSDRAALKALVDKWVPRLQILLDRPATIPPFPPFQSEDLPKLTAREFADRLRATGRVEAVDVVEDAGEPLHLDSGSYKTAFSGALIIDCRFERCDFRDVTFGPNARLIRTRFVDCDFRGARGHLSASSVIFENCPLSGARFSEASVGHSIFEATSRNARDVEDLHIPHSTFTHCVFRGLQLVKCDLEGSSFTDSVFDEVQIERSNAQRTVFCESSLAFIEFAGTQLELAVFSSSDIEQANFRPHSRSSTRFTGTVPDYHLELPAYLTGTDFRRAFGVRDAYFTDEQLRRAEFSLEDREALLANTNQEFGQ
jgi:uncharacterized protein YjbI with pentapeptide repeats